MTRGDKIKAYMIKKGIEPKELADRLDISLSYLYKVLANKSTPSQAIIKKLAEVLECDIEELVPEEGETTDKIYYDEPGIFNRLPKDLQEFVADPQNEAYIRFGKQMKRYDIDELLENIDNEDMKFLLAGLKMYIDQQKKD